MGTELKPWRLKFDAHSSIESIQNLGYSRVMSELLAHRNLCTQEEISRFLQPKLKSLSDPFMLPAMQAAVDRILAAAQAGEKVAIFGDYDVDGVTSVSFLVKLLEAYNIDVCWGIPRRQGETYGLNQETLERAFYSKGEDFSLMIAVDCATNSYEEIESLYQNGVETIVIDHHEVSETRRSKGLIALVNPKVDKDNEFDYLCTVGLIFKLGHALLKQSPIENINLKDYLDLVAMGTIADMSPLIGDNRILAVQGFEQLKKTKHLGMSSLIKLSKIDHLQFEDIGYKLSPKINSAGRMYVADTAVEMVLSSNNQEAFAKAELLHNYNEERKICEAGIVEQARQMYEESQEMKAQSVIVLGSSDWNSGVIGIVASRLSMQYQKPCFIIAFEPDGIGKGSGRSVGDVSLIDSIAACQDSLIDGGGHKMAAGIRLKIQDLAKFRQQFHDYVYTQQQSTALLLQSKIDVEVQLSELTLDFLDEYEQLNPFGIGNPKPQFLARRLYNASPERWLKDGQHLKLSLTQDNFQGKIDAIYFNAGREHITSGPWDIAFNVSRNTFRNRNYLQLVVQKMWASE